MRLFNFLIALIFFAQVASAELSPTATVQDTIDKILAVLEDSETVGKEEQREQIFKVVDAVFDFEEMSKRSLGANWKKCTEQEQGEFVSVFSDFLSETYINRIDDIEPGMVEVVSEKIIGQKSLVKTSVKLGDQTFPLDYKMLNRGKGWEVYDVVIENVGLVSNYRNEFSGIVRKEKIAGLIQKLQDKVQALKDKKSDAS